MTWLALSSCTDLSCLAQTCSTPLQLSARCCCFLRQLIAICIVECFIKVCISGWPPVRGGAVGVCGHCQRHYNVAAQNVLLPDAHPLYPPPPAAIAPAPPPPPPPVAAATRRPQNSRMQLITATMRPCSDRKWPLSHVPLSVVLAMKSK